MFADELAGNPAKKRADEARARRLRAKREEQAKQRRREDEKKKASASSASQITQNAISNSESEDVRAVFNQAQENRNTASHINNVGEEKSAAAIAESLAAPELSAAEKAAEQRKLRAEQRIITR